MRPTSAEPRARGRSSSRAAVIGLLTAAVLTLAAPASGAPVAGPPPAAATSLSSSADGPAPVEVSLKSPDGHEFKGLYFTTDTAESKGILIVPALAGTRDHFLRLARTLRDRGYRVLSMDNSGLIREVHHPAHGKVTIDHLGTSKIFLPLVTDVATGLASLRSQPGVGRIAILGFGMGANASLVAGARDDAVEGVAAIVPSYGCEEFDPYVAFGDMNKKPMLLLESRKRFQSDLAMAFEHIMAKRKDLPLTHVMLRRDPDALTQQDLEADYEEAVLVWLDKVFPTSPPPTSLPPTSLH